MPKYVNKKAGPDGETYVNTYDEIDIYVDDNGRFCMLAEPWKDQTFDSYKAACAAIDTEKATQTKIKLGKLKLDLEALDEKGNRVIVTGINRTDRSIMIKDGKFEGRVVYPREPWVEVALKRRAELVQEQAELNKKLNKCEAESGTGYWGRISAERYEEAIGFFKDSFDKAVKAAKAKAPK